MKCRRVSSSPLFDRAGLRCECPYELASEGVDAAANKERAALLESSYLGAKDPTSLRIIPKLQLNANDDDFFLLNLAQRKPPQAKVS